MASRLEINFVRLLSRCETMASEKRGETEWRLEKVRLIRVTKKYTSPTLVSSVVGRMLLLAIVVSRVAVSRC